MSGPTCRSFAAKTTAGIAFCLATAGIPADSALLAQSDLDAFMRQVMERRDDNWKKLQQYILDEREEFDLRGPGGFPLWGERRDFTWFIRDGFFVRSPLRVNGATVGEDDRRAYEANYLRRVRNRDKQERARASEPAPAPLPPDNLTPPSGNRANIESFIQQTRQPEFVSTAYFLRFKFDTGRYALVGREKLDGHDVLRVEYYPTRLFDDDRARERRRQARENREGRGRPNDPKVDDTVNRLMNKGSRITLWVEPTAHQILKYTFDNVDMDFFPGQWLTSVTGAHASMTMGQPFPDVWLPQAIDIRVGLMFAVGEVEMRFAQSYFDYRRADVTTAIRVPGIQ